MSLGLETYETGRKQAFRGWIWNRIIELLANRFEPKKSRAGLKAALKDFTAVYLAGSDGGADRKIALERGFSDNNLIAIDVVPDYIKKVRDNGGLGMVCTLQDALLYWPAGWPIDVVIADFHCGWDTNIFAFANALLFSQATNGASIIALNIQRGRDAKSNERREKITSAMPAAGKHRGRQFVFAMIHSIAKLSGKPISSKSELANAWAFMNPVFASWRSSGSAKSTILLDTAVFRKSCKLTTAEKQIAISECLSAVPHGEEWPTLKTRNFSRDFAALKAVRTKRLAA